MNIKINSSILSRVFFVCYVIYSYTLSYSLFFVRGLSAILLLGALVFELHNDKYHLHKEKSFAAYFVFLLYVISTGVIVATDTDRMLSSAMTFAECLASYYLIISYAQNDKKIDFPINVFVLHGLVTAVFTSFSGAGIERATIANEVNANVVAVTMAFSIAFILYEMIGHNKSPVRVIFIFGAVLFLLFAILLTVSKKAIFGAIVLIILWIACCYKTTFSQVKKVYKMILFLSVIAICIISIIWYASNYAAQIEYMQIRMSEITTGTSSVDRIELFKEGIRIFLEHPFLGVGFNNARYYTALSTYTHCYYSEILACTGFIGTLIYTYALGVSWRRIKRSYKPIKQINKIAAVKVAYMISIFVVLLLISATQIMFYMYNLMYVLAILAGFSIETREYMEMTRE